MENKGKLFDDVVISTRVRIARNIEKLPFSHLIRGTEKEEEVYALAKEALLKKGTDFTLLKMKDLDSIKKERYVEQHILSPELASSNHGGIIISFDEKLSVMLLEEDHFRIQVVEEGFFPRKALDIAKELERMLGQKVNYAYHKRFGYLTSCPTNVGTGMRMGVMMHLPALTRTKGIGTLLENLPKIGFTVRGIYGEGSEAEGNVYQISNQVTLGVTEENILKSLSSVTETIRENEMMMRKRLYETKKTELEDEIMRSYGLLKYARRMDSREMLLHLSNINLGISLGLIPNISHREVYQKMTEGMPAMLAQKHSTAEERDKRRVEILRSMF